MALEVFVLPCLVAPGLEGGKALFLPPHLSPVNPERRAGEFGQETTVVADQDKPFAGTLQFVFEPANRFDIEVVGRFVKQHQVRVLRHQPRQRRATALAARGGFDRAGGIEFEPLACTLHLVEFRRIKPMHRVIAKRCEGAEVGVLFHVTGADARWHDAVALVGFDAPSHHFHQGRFARPVSANKRNAVPRLHHKAEIMEHRLTTEGQRDVVELEKRNDGHAAALRRGARKVKGVGGIDLRGACDGAQPRLAGFRHGVDGKTCEDVQRVELEVPNRMVTDPAAHAQITAQQVRQAACDGTCPGQIDGQRRQTFRAQPIRAKVVCVQCRQCRKMGLRVGTGKRAAANHHAHAVAIDKNAKRRPRQPQRHHIGRPVGLAEPTQFKKGTWMGTQRCKIVELSCIAAAQIRSIADKADAEGDTRRVFPGPNNSMQKPVVKHVFIVQPVAKRLGAHGERGLAHIECGADDGAVAVQAQRHIGCFGSDGILRRHQIHQFRKSAAFNPPILPKSLRMKLMSPSPDCVMRRASGTT